MVVPFVLSLTFAISIAQLSSPQLVVRFIAAKDQRVLAYGMILTPLIVGIFAICVFSVGPLGWLVIPKEEVPTFLKDVDRVVPYIAMKVLPEGINAPRRHNCGSDVDDKFPCARIGNRPR
jgi:Na+/pantothenate symporter